MHDVTVTKGRLHHPEVKQWRSQSPFKNINGYYDIIGIMSLII